MAGDGYVLIEDGAVVVRDHRVAWVGPRRDLPAEWDTAEQHDSAQAWLTPGLIGCHTHLIYAGSRADESERRLQGETCEQIARGGGGIVSAVRATLAATEDELLAASAKRLRALMHEGVTTVEIKSGYGLDTDRELKLLRVARQLGR